MTQVTISDDRSARQRCRDAVERVVMGHREDVELTRLVADLSRLPVGDPERARLVPRVIAALARPDVSGDVEHLRQLGELVRLADADPPHDPGWPALRAVARALYLGVAVARGEVADLAAAEAELTRLTEVVRDQPAARTLVEGARSAVSYGRAMAVGDQSALRRMTDDVSRLTAEFGDPRLEPMKAVLEAATQGLAANQRGDTEAVFEHMRELEAVSLRLPPGPMRQMLAESLTQLRSLSRMSSGTVSSDEERAAMVELVDRPGISDHTRGMYQLGLAGELLRGGQETDLELIGSAIDHLREAVRLTGAGGPNHGFCLTSLALGLLRQCEVSGRTDGLGEVERLLCDARTSFGDAGHPLWTFANELLATLRHRTGQLYASGDDGMQAQRGYAWRALLESDAAGARLAIRNAAAGAIASARSYAAVGSPADAFRALDTGRGLILFAATALHTIPARLRVAGHAELARRWASGEDSRDLRRQALEVLAAREDPAERLMDPPTAGEVAAALTALDADALVYLVPAEQTLPGLAVIVAADGSAGLMALPELRLGADTDVDRYLAALAASTRELEPAPGTDPSAELADRLSALSDWAWRAAIGPLLVDYFGRRPARPDGRVPRIVLIPMGELARVPWPAARRRDGTYAVRLAAFSHAVSARLLCENAARSPVPCTSTGLVVGDPQTRARPLPSARIEAHSVRRAHYPGGRYIGRVPRGSVSPTGRGTAGEVRTWLVDLDPSAGSTLHLAVHGSFRDDRDDATSLLLLAPEGDDGGELTAEDVLTLLASAPRRRLGLVVLAACHSGRSVHGYDEAYSLGSAFLAAGTRSVLSTLWAVPDAPTSPLMFMFHHYRRHAGLPSWQALRQAQMWMLDPRRVAPSRMPAELMSHLRAGQEAPVGAWAGFIHFGQ